MGKEEAIRGEGRREERMERGRKFEGQQIPLVGIFF